MIGVGFGIERKMVDCRPSGAHRLAFTVLPAPASSHGFVGDTPAKYDADTAQVPKL
jgi:hypothetical protein